MTSLRQTEADKLLDAVFMPRGIFRTKFDDHVRLWGLCIGRECFARYHTRPAFAAAYDARQFALRSTPLPAWKEPA